MELGTFLNLLGFLIVLSSLVIGFLEGGWKIRVLVFIPGAFIQGVGLLIHGGTVETVCGIIMLFFGITYIPFYFVLRNNERKVAEASHELSSPTESSGGGYGH